MLPISFFDYVKRGKLPAWEKSYMLTKYYITTMALEKATKGERVK